MYNIKINDDKFILVLYLQSSLGGHISKVLEDNYKAILNTAINTKLLDIEYKIEEAFKESSV